MGFPTVDVPVATSTAVSAAADVSQVAILSQQLLVAQQTLSQTIALAESGARLLGVQGAALDVLKGLREELEKAGQITGPLAALVAAILQLDKTTGDLVAGNLNSLVSQVSQLGAILDEKLGLKLPDAIREALGGVGEKLDGATKEIAGLGKGIETTGKAQADQTAAVAEAIQTNSIWTKLGDEQLKQLRAATTCQGFGGIADVGIKAIQGVTESVVKTLACFIERDLLPIAKALESLVSIPFAAGGRALINDALGFFDAMGEADPRTANTNAAKLLNFALLKGSEAHGIALAIEAVPYFKHIGFPQLAAFLVDIAGFNVVGRAVIGTRVRAAVETPLRYLAQRTHRPTLPDIGSASTAWAELALSDNDFKELLRWHGVPEAFLPMFLEIADREPTLRDLAFVFDDNEVSDQYLVRAVQKAGFRGENADVLHASLATRANRSWRSGLVNEMRLTVQVGLRDVGWLETNLRALGFRRETVILISTSATLARAREHAEELAKSWEQLAKDQVIDLDDLKLSLAGLGFTSAAILERISIIAARLTGQIAKEERTEIKQAIRKVQTTRTTQAIEAFRRGLIDRPQLEGALVALGIVEQQAAAMAELEETKLTPRPSRVESDDPDALTEKVLQARRDETLLLLRNGSIDADRAFGFLVELGVDPELADALVGKELARIKPPKELLEVAA